MEKTYKYTTLKGLLKAQSTHTQFSLNTLRSGRLLHKKAGWVKYKITEEVRQLIEDLFKTITGETYLYNGEDYGIYNRLIIELKNNKISSQYNAGQSYPDELRTLRKCLKN